MTVHHVISWGENHHPLNLQYPTEAARVAGSGELHGIELSEGNLYDLAYVVETQNTWQLIQVTPTKQWRRFDAGQLNTTLGDMTVYVDPSGNDITGDGSAAYPYATWDRALQLPFVTRHKIKIKPAAGVYNSFPVATAHLPLDRGHIVIDASDLEPTVISSHTVDTLIARGEFYPNYGVVAHMTVTGMPGWAEDELYGLWIRVTAGASAGKFFPIYWNDSTKIKLPYIGLVTGAITEFDIVDPAVVINADHDISLQGFGGTLSRAYFSESNAPMFPSYCCAGIRFNITPRPAAYRPSGQRNSALVVTGAGFLTSFVTINKTTADDSYARVLYMANGALNWGTTSTDSIFDNSGSHGNRFTNIISNNGVPPTAYNRHLQIYNGHAQYACVRGVTACYASSLPSIGNICTGQLDLNSCSGGLLNNNCIDAIGYSSKGIMLDDTHIHANYIWVENADTALHLSRDSSFTTDWLRAGTITGPYAAYINRNSHISKLSTTNFDALGTVGAVQFQFGGATHATWPSAGNAYLNGDGSTVVGYG